MPNWCSNSIDIIGDRNALEYIQSTQFDFSILRPIPDNVDWYDNHVNHWGTKWTPIDVECKLNDEMLHIECRTAWSPPVALIRYLSQKYELQITMNFTGEMYEYIGYSKIQNGQEQTDFIYPDEHDDAHLQQYALTHTWFCYNEWRRYMDDIS